VQLYVNPSSKALNGVSGVFTAIGKPGTLTPTFKPLTGELDFSFSTLEEGHLVLGAASYDGVMQMSIIEVTEGAGIRMVSSSRIELNPDGSEGRVDSAGASQLRALSERFNAAAGILETFLVAVDTRGTVTYEFTTGDRKTKAAGTIPPEGEPRR
jgi:hypothetical protein